MLNADVGEATLVRFDARGDARRRLYCFPFAGGGPATFRLWPNSLADDVEVVVVVAPGRDPRTRSSNETVPGSMAGIIAPTLAAIDDMQSTSPLEFAFFGHSMGSLIAYEATVGLEERAASDPDRHPAPTHLFASGRRPPDQLHRGESIHTLDDDEFIDKMQQNYGGIPDLVRNEPDLLALFLPGLRADVEVFETYAPLTDRRVSCPVRVYGGADDRGPRPDQLPGWQRLADREISLRTFPGGHFYLNDARDDLAADLMAYWNQPEPATPNRPPTA